MQFTTLVSALAMALMVSAAPADIEARTSGDNSICKAAGDKQVCCNGILDCVVQALGSACTTKSYCCKSAGNKAVVSTLQN